MVISEIESRRRLFCELPASACQFQNICRRKRIKPVRNCSAWCGQKTFLFNFKRTGYPGATLFCRYKNCFENYGKSLGSYSADLSNGVPHIWQYVNVSTNNPRYCKVPEHEMDSKGRLIDLICMCCGIQNDNVISHPLVPEKYAATSFCKNETCYSSF